MKRISRRQILRSAAGAGAALVAGAGLQKVARSEEVTPAGFDGSLFPKVTVSAPSDSDWRSVGERCLRRRPDEANAFKDITLRFMGLQEKNRHTELFRALLESWRAYTGATIEWVDLSQGEYTAKLQKTLREKATDVDLLEMSALLEGEFFDQDLLMAMPDSTREAIEFEDYFDYLRSPIGSWKHLPRLS
jgi:multiple sugar transport system substrate-binding protein